MIVAVFLQIIRGTVNVLDHDPGTAFEVIRHIEQRPPLFLTRVFREMLPFLFQEPHPQQALPEAFDGFRHCADFVFPQPSFDVHIQIACRHSRHLFCEAGDAAGNTAAESERNQCCRDKNDQGRDSQPDDQRLRLPFHVIDIDAGPITQPQGSNSTA